jgi:hypothetical protein
MLSLPAREAFFSCPASLEQFLGLGLEPSRPYARGVPRPLLAPAQTLLTPRAPSARAECIRPRLPACASDPTALPAVWPLGVGMRAPRRLPTPGQRVGDPHAPAQWLLWPAGRTYRHPPVRQGSAGVPSPCLSVGCYQPVCGVRGGGSSLRPSGGTAIPPEAAGPERASRSGVSLARSHANSEGSPLRGVPAWSQPKELRAAARGDAQGPNAANPRGKTKAFTQ